MRQFILREEPDKAGLVRLRGADYHYLVHVRRIKPGAVFTAWLPAGGSFSGGPISARVRSIGNHVLELEIPPEDSGAKYARPGPENGIYRDRPAPAGTGLPPILLFQALPKGNKMDLIVRQAAEGGISEVIPFTADHSVPEGSSRGREERWRRIAREARQQSGSAVDTRVSSPLSAGALFDRWNTLEPGALGLVLHPPLAQGSFHHYLYRDPSLIVLAVGPEGGFSAAELTRFTNAGFKSLCLGDTVLRTETAALYGAAAVRIILLEKAWWTLK